MSVNNETAYSIPRRRSNVDIWSFAPEVLTALVGGGGVLKSIAFVQEGSLGVKLRFGKAVRNRAGEPAVVSPGFVFMIPFVDSLVRFRVRQQTIRFDQQSIMLTDGTVFQVSAIAIFTVVDIYKVLFEVDDLYGSLADFCMSVLRDEFSGLSSGDMKDIREISEKLMEQVEETSTDWGVKFTLFKLTDCSPTDETARLLLTGRQALARTTALIEAAEALSVPVEQLHPSIAAALVGVPLVLDVGKSTALTKPMTKPLDHSQHIEEDGDDD
jgi:regulator of protease activity HflC (stomatin/prohibitin superfamily)